MPKEYNRSERVADFIKREIALLLQRELRDPRISNVNINAVVVSRDMSTAKIYATFFEVLNGAAGFIRTQLASQHSMRSTPKLRFYFDDSVRQGEHLSNLIDRAIAGSGSDDN